MSIKGPASREALWALHRLVTKCLTEYMLTTPRNKLRATFLQVVVTFLSHNGIKADPTAPRDAANGLAQLAGMKIPFATPEQ